MASIQEDEPAEEISQLRLDEAEPDFRTLRSHRPVTNRTGLSKRRKTEDITKQFLQAARELTTGQLVKDESFTLFESVGALEIMDPKMDSGFLAPGETFGDDYDVLRKLLPEEVVGIMDQLLCSEMAWHSGHPLPQTLFTSMYIDHLLWPEPKTLAEACFGRSCASTEDEPLLHIVLRAYCLALIKTCNFVYKRVTQETYFEEEDFFSNLYNRNLLSRPKVFELDQLLDEAIVFVENEKYTLSENIRRALLDRLEFRRSFLNALSNESTPNKPNLPFWEACSNLLPKLTQSHGLGTPVADCFTTKIQRRLASTAPPRPIFNITFQRAIENLKRLCKDASDVADVLNCEGGSDILTFTLGFESRKPQPSVLMRCILQSMILGGQDALGSIDVKQVIIHELEHVVLPAHILLDPTNCQVEAPQDPRFQISKRMDIFINRIAQPYFDVIRALNMNRCRARRMLCHTILDWENVQLDAEELDVDLRPYTKEEPLIDHTAGGEHLWSFPLSSWIYYHKLKQMAWIVQFGFELQVYQDHELAGMYWYLQHLANIRIQHIGRIRTFTTRSQNRISRLNPSQKKAFDRSFSFLTFATLEAQATQSFADALSCLYTCLIHLSLIPTPSSLPYSTSTLRYALRMRPFLSISIPTVPTHDKFSALVNPFNLDPNQNPVRDRQRLHTLLDSAELGLKIARKEWEAVSKTPAAVAQCNGSEEAWRGKTRDVLRSTIAAGITVMGVKRWVGQKEREGWKEGSARLKIDLGEVGYHEWWVVPRVGK